VCAVRLGESPASGPEIPWQTTREYTTSIARVPSPTVNLANPRTREPANPRTREPYVCMWPPGIRSQTRQNSRISTAVPSDTRMYFS